MTQPVTRDQALELSRQFLSQVRWTKLDKGLVDQIISLRPEEFGQRFTAFLKAGAQMNPCSHVLRIDRSQPFDPAAFIAPGWTIWRGSANGDGLHGEEEQDSRSLALSEIYLADIQLVTMLRPSELLITGEERLKRLKRTERIRRLDANVFLALRSNPSCISEAFKEKVGGDTQYIFFDGTVLRSPNGLRCVLCLCSLAGGWLCPWLGRGWGSAPSSAVLAS